MGFDLGCRTDWPRMVGAGKIRSDWPGIILRNVNAGGNPIGGESLLATLRVPLQGLTELQWCLTPTRNKDDEDTFMGHAMLRFLFEPERRSCTTTMARPGRPTAPCGAT